LHNISIDQNGFPDAASADILPPGDPLLKLKEGAQAPAIDCPSSAFYVNIPREDFGASGVL
jgi:hypothetical protein